MQELNPSAKAPSGWRRAKLVAGTLALTMAAFGTVAAVTVGTAYAYAPVTTQAYTISGAAGAVSGVTATDSPATYPGTGNFTIKFTTPSVLVAAASGYSSILLTVAPNLGVAAPIGMVGVVDPSTGYVATVTPTRGVDVRPGGDGDRSSHHSGLDQCRRYPHAHLHHG